MPTENSSEVDVAEPVTNDQKIFRESYDRCIHLNDGDVKFVNHFYSKLKARNSTISALLESYPVYFQVRLVRVVIYLLADFRSSHSLSPEFKNFMKSHSGLQADLQPFMLSLCLECLLETVVEFDPGYDDRVRAAWLSVLKPGLDYLQSELAAAQTAPNSNRAQSDSLPANGIR